MTWGVVVFPGANCDHDCYHVVRHVLDTDCRFVRHKETDLSDLDGVILPGGFSYGDYLRAGAIARVSPVMESVAEFAKRGGPVLGICNGFQILCEAGLLPGALLRNAGLSFVCKDAELIATGAASTFTNGYSEGQRLTMPIAHGQGRYHADDETLRMVQGEGQVVFRYADNPNGSLDDIAGLRNGSGNVVGMMPHPERCAEEQLGNTDGLPLFESGLLQSALGGLS
jgi:phosphoribosylformylglycinamidine synthase